MQAQQNKHIGGETILEIGLGAEDERVSGARGGEASGTPNSARCERSLECELSWL